MRKLKFSCERGEEQVRKRWRGGVREVKSRCERGEE